MKIYAVIHAVAGLYEGYSDTTCEFFPDRDAAQKHIDQVLGDYRKDEMCVNIDPEERGTPSSPWTATLTTTACVPSDMDHDDYVAEHGRRECRGLPNRRG